MDGLALKYGHVVDRLEESKGVTLDGGKEEEVALLEGQLSEVTLEQPEHCVLHSFELILHTILVKWLYTDILITISRTIDHPIRHCGPKEAIHDFNRSFQCMLLRTVFGTQP